MEVMEINPIMNKDVKIIIMESEFPIEWWLEPPAAGEQSITSQIGIISKNFAKLVEDIVQRFQPDFVVEEKGNRPGDSLHYDDHLVDIFRKFDVPFQMVDIPDHALNYLNSGFDDIKASLIEFDTEIKRLKKKGGVHPNNFTLERITAQHCYLKNELEKGENEIRFKVRENWMMKQIVDIARKQRKDKPVGLFICDKGHFKGIAGIADEFGIEIEMITMEGEQNIMIASKVN